MLFRSLAVLGGGLELTFLGKTYVAIQAVTVAALALLQYVGLRQARLQLHGERHDHAKA